MQSFLNVLSVSGDYIFQLVDYLSPNRPDMVCARKSMDLIADIMRQFGQMCTVLVIFAFTKSFREMIISGWKKVRGGTQETSVTNSTIYSTGT